jgi:hypothetical protein
MGNTIRIKTDVGKDSDKYIKVKLEQEFDFIEILSLQISQEDAYRKFCSDYGVIVGRVNVNSGFGVPNAKVSIFIPIEDIDKNDTVISGIYPFEVLNDKNNEGIRYNLFNKEPQSNNDCFTPIGTFPTKREILDNSTIMDVYCKYYKFTTTTNHAGDFMLFGVPIGNHTVHIDADISDIGIISQRPYDLIRQGAPSKLFESSTKFKGGTNIDKLAQVKTSNIGVNVRPFWGDADNCTIGISRVDVDLNYTVTPSAIFTGSIYGDNYKHSVNKTCRPRKALGELCDQITGTGSIEIIRKTIDGTIEELTVDDGDIDENGVWAFQIPMNLDYVITAEDGTLILSDDPNKGIPTKSTIRFRIKMDETSDQGRLRTRASYLIPNNPQTKSEIDYEFGDNTKDTSFKDLYWNKIYTISNFITRYQTSSAGDLFNKATTVSGAFSVSNTTRNMTAIKNVDDCVGQTHPFPFNRINASTNPIFIILCLIISIIGFIIYIINYIVISIINRIISFLKDVVDVINSIFDINISIDYLACIVLKCDDNGYAPGCEKSSDGYDSLETKPTRYCGDGFSHTCSFGNLVGFDDCIKLQLANSLAIYQLDFYNDWVNGSLFSYLLKYKKKSSGREVFCEYDCADYVGQDGYSGVDGNNNGIPDNDCQSSILSDSLFQSSKYNINGNQDENRTTPVIREGLIKQYDNHLYYASTIHNSAFKLFATDIVCLGSVFDCDWQGFPKLQQFLIETTYKIPPNTAETTNDINNNEIITTSGLIDEGGTSKGLFFSIDCIGVHVNDTQALNIRHICEFGVDIDEMIQDPLTNVITPPDGVIGSNDIDETFGKQFRDSFIVLNKDVKSTYTYNIPSTGLTSNFNTSQPNTANWYDFATSINDNGPDYIDFRAIGSDSLYSQPKHSFYFYFGLLPGKTSLDKMKKKYFSVCIPKINSTIIIETLSTPNTNDDIHPNGDIKFRAIGGHGPYTYTIKSNNGYSFNGSVKSDSNNINQSQQVDVGDLKKGSYTITITDSLNNTVSKTVIINGPTPFYCSVIVTQNSTSLGSNDGIITINSVGGGNPPYKFTVTDYLGGSAGTPSSGTITSQPLAIKGLPVDNTNGYIVTVTDGTSNCVTNKLYVGGPSYLHVSTTKTDTSCNNKKDGTLTINISGGVSPFTINTTGPSAYSNNSVYLTHLSTGTYVTTVVDSLSQTASVSTVISNSSVNLIIATPSTSDLQLQCDPLKYNIPINITNGLYLGSTAYISYSLDNSSTWNDYNVTYVSSTKPIILSIDKKLLANNIRIKFSDTSSHNCYSNIITIYTSSMPLPTSKLDFTISTTGSYVHTISTPTGGIGSNTGSPYSTGVYTDSLPTITTTFTDSVGCKITKVG